MLLVMVFALSGGGCGGGGGGDDSFDDGGGYPYVPPIEDPTDPDAPSFTNEDVAEAEEVIKSVEQSVYAAHKDEGLSFEELMDVYVSALEADAKVKYVTRNIGKNVFETFLKIDFVSGYKSMIGFMSEEYLESIYGDSDSTASYAARTSAVSTFGVHKTSVVPRDGVLNAFVGKSMIKLSDGMPWTGHLDSAQGERNYLLSLASGQPRVELTDKTGFSPSPEMELDDLRHLFAYDYIYIGAHGNNDGWFAIQFPDAPFSFLFQDERLIEDVAQNRVSAVHYIPIIGNFINGDKVDILDWTDQFIYGNYLYIMPKFFTDYYGGGRLGDPIIFLQSCGLLNTRKLSDVLIEAGAKAVIGYDESVDAAYGNKFSPAVIKNLISGDSVETAVNSAIALPDVGPVAGYHDVDDENGNRIRIEGHPTVHTGAGVNAGDVYLVSDTITPPPTEPPTPPTLPDPPATNGNWIDVADTEWYNAASQDLTISTAAELAGLVKLVNEGNIFSGKTITLAGDIDLAGRQWTPIKSFNGTFDGGDHTIFGMTAVIETTNSYASAALFGINRGRVKGVNLSGVYVSSYSLGNLYLYYSMAGGIAGENLGTIENCTSSGTVSSSNSSAASYAGGIAGTNGGERYSNGTIKNCTSSGMVFSSAGTRSYAGGIAGQNTDTIENCESGGTVSSSVKSSYSDNYSCAGGIVGFSGYAYTDYVTIRDCTSRVSEVTATNTRGGNAYSGGFIGYLSYFRTAITLRDNRNEGGVMPAIGLD